MVVETSVGFDTPVEAFPQPRGKKVDVPFLNAFHPSNSPRFKTSWVESALILEKDPVESTQERFILPGNHSRNTKHLLVFHCCLRALEKVLLGAIFQ